MFQKLMLQCLLLALGTFPLYSKDLAATQVTKFLKCLKTLSGEFTQIIISKNGQEQEYSGKITLDKTKGTKGRIIYTSGLDQEITIDGACLIIKDLRGEKKPYHCSISQTPIYNVLTGNLDLSKEKFDILENTKEVYSIHIKKSALNFILTFSKYPNGNIQYLISWTIEDGNSKNFFMLNPKTLKLQTSPN